MISASASALLSFHHIKDRAKIESPAYRGDTAGDQAHFEAIVHDIMMSGALGAHAYLRARTKIHFHCAGDQCDARVEGPEGILAGIIEFPDGEVGKKSDLRAYDVHHGILGADTQLFDNDHPHGYTPSQSTALTLVTLDNAPDTQITAMATQLTERVDRNGSFLSEEMKDREIGCGITYNEFARTYAIPESLTADDFEMERLILELSGKKGIAITEPDTLRPFYCVTVEDNVRHADRELLRNSINRFIGTHQEQLR